MPAARTHLESITCTSVQASGRGFAVRPVKDADMGGTEVHDISLERGSRFLACRCPETCAARILALIKDSDKGKPAARRGRKASGLMVDDLPDSGAAGTTAPSAIQSASSHDPRR